MIWIAKRIAVALVLVWIVATVVFLAIQMVPGDPAEILLSQGGVAPDPAIVEELRTQLGLDRPVLEQYRDSMWGLLHGDLGVSLIDGNPVSGLIAQRLPRTLELIGAAALLALLIGLPTGLIAAMRRGGAFDRASSLMAAMALSIPVFVLGTMLVLIFAQILRLVPAGGYVPFAQSPGQHLLLLTMPAMTIALSLGAMVFRMTRASVLDVSMRDYIRTARAKGIAPARILLHHVLRNSLMPVVTVVALQLGTLLGGTVLVEYVFNYPGLSGLLVDAVNSRDYTIVQGVVLVISILFVGLNLLVDLLYAVIDPRVRHA
jgi:peptide/nickel transport system permease protein